MKTNNKGISLVELIIVIGMFAIVGAMVVSFVAISTRTYTNASAEIDIQEEAQLTLNQVKDLMIDTNRAVSYGLEAPDPSNMKGFTVIDATNTEASLRADWIADGVNPEFIKEILVIYSEESHTTTTGGVTTTTYDYPIVKIIYDDFTGNLYYAESTFASTASIDVSSFGTTSSDMYLLSQYVTDFNIDLANIEDSQVDMQIDFSSGSGNTGREYLATPTINLRNKVIVSENLTDIYSDPGVTINSFVASIDILRNNTIIHNDGIQKGTSATYTAKVDAQYGASEGYTWMLTGDHSGFKSTVDVATGTVTVPIDEPSSMLTLTAIATGDTSKTKSIPISASAGVSVSNFTISVDENPISNAGPDEVRMIYTFTATTSYTDGHTTTGEDVSWAMPSNVPAGSTCAVNGAGQLVLSLKQDAGGTNYTVSANTEVINAAGIYLSDSKTVSPPDLTYIAPIALGVNIEPEANNVLSRGGQIELSADVDFTGDLSGLTYQWEILSDESTGFSGSGVDSIGKVSMSGTSGTTSTISSTKNLNWDGTYMVRVKVTVSGTAGGQTVTGTDTKDIHILPVEISARIMKTEKEFYYLTQKFAYELENVELTTADLNASTRYFTYSSNAELYYHNGLYYTLSDSEIRRDDDEKIWTANNKPYARAAVRRFKWQYISYYGGSYWVYINTLNYNFTIEYDGNNSITYHGTISD